MQVGYYKNLTELIEHAVDSNDGRQATIVAHSLGCLVSLYFITQQPSEWLQKHVISFVAISAPWAGSITALKGKSNAHALTLLASLRSHFNICMLLAHLGQLCMSCVCSPLNLYIHSDGCFHFPPEPQQYVQAMP